MRRGFYRADPPDPRDFGTSGEYEEAVRAWEDAEDAAAEEYVERTMEEKHGERERD